MTSCTASEQELIAAWDTWGIRPVKAPNKNDSPTRIQKIQLIIVIPPKCGFLDNFCLSFTKIAGQYFAFRQGSIDKK